VVEAGNLEEAVRTLEQQPVDIAVAALDLPPGGSAKLLSAMRGRPEWKGIPLLVLVDSAEQMRSQAGQPADFEDCQVKFDQEAMLKSVARLATHLAGSETVPVEVGEER